MTLILEKQTRVPTDPKPRSSRAWLAGALAIALAPALVSARGPIVRECDPGGPPAAVADLAPSSSTRPLQRQEEGWLVAASKSQRPRLFSPKGEAIELPQPPSSAETTSWVARGRAVFAVGTAPSQAHGKTNVVLLRWGVDNRPRVTALASVESVSSKPVAALAGERLAVVWGEPRADRRSHLMLSITDLEELRVQSPIDLGVQQGEARIAASESGFVVMWANEKGVQRALYDAKGKQSGAVQVIAGVGKDTPRTLQRCGEQAFLLHDAGNEVAISTLDASGVAKQIARVPAPPAGEPIATSCVGDSLAIGHRVVSPKGDNVVLWLSTLGATGKLRQRKVRDVRGSSDALHSLQLTSEPGGLRAWWLQGEAATAQLWARDVVCK
ncbi:MAG TPA: hypothetical protein VK509_17715 [Polyangiales bacterium]|nr:hypothetical protein [Polyangiales bacterium]